MFRRIINSLLVFKWRIKGYKIPFDSHISRGVNFLGDISFGRGFYIGRHSYIETHCLMGDDVLISNYVGIICKYDHWHQEIGKSMRKSTHFLESNFNFKSKSQLTVTIEDDVWIGRSATILSGVRLGEGCIVAAGSVVTKDVPSYTIVAGNPAVRVGDRFNSTEHLNLHKMIVRSNK